MTDRLNTLTVVLTHDIRDDDAEHLMSAIRMLRGVLSVGGDVADPVSYMAEMRAKQELRERLFKVLDL